MPVAITREHLEGLFPTATVDSLDAWLGTSDVPTYVVRGATATTLAAYTRTGNVILADAVGALGATDGVTYVTGERLLLKNGAAGADNGIYVVEDPGAAGAKYQLRRSADFDDDAEVVAGCMVVVSEGTLNGNETFILTSDDPVVVNTSTLTFTAMPSYVDLASTAAGLGASLVGINDAGSIITATTVEAALQEIQTALDAEEAALVAYKAAVALATTPGGASLVGVFDTAGHFTATTVEAVLAEIAVDMDTVCPGMPMMNRLRMLGAPGAIVAADTVTIGGDVYEFRADTPPSGGTAGRIWVYNGANSAASRANLIAAINNEGAAAEVTYDGAVTESMYALAGVTTGDVVILSATGIGTKVAAPSTTATATTEGLTTAEDIWDETTMYGGKAEQPTQIGRATITVDTAHVDKGTLEAYFDFTPTTAIVKNRMRPQDEAWTITGNAVSLTLAGGAAPNNQANDVIDIIAIA